MKFNWFKKEKDNLRNIKGKVKDLPTAAQALEKTKEPQLRNCIEKVEAAMKAGLSHTYVGDNEKLHKETIDYLTQKGYDIHINYFPKDDSSFIRNRDEYYNEVFWSEGATGICTFDKK